MLENYTFLPFSMFLAVFWIFTYKKVPETKNKTFDEIATLFKIQNKQKWVHLYLYKFTIAFILCIILWVAKLNHLEWLRQFTTTSTWCLGVTGTWWTASTTSLRSTQTVVHRTLSFRQMARSTKTTRWVSSTQSNHGKIQNFLLDCHPKL